MEGGNLNHSNLEGVFLGAVYGVYIDHVILTSNNKAAAREDFKTWFSSVTGTGTYVLRITVGATMWGIGCKYNNDNGQFNFGSYWMSNLGKSVTISGGTWTWTD